MAFIFSAAYFPQGPLMMVIRSCSYHICLNSPHYIQWSMKCQPGSQAGSVDQ
jgi:hypothetical protein